jgi:hypothetical protein
MDVSALDRAVSCDQGLAHDLSAENPLGSFLWTSPTKNVELDFFEIEQVEQ